MRASDIETLVSVGRPDLAPDGSFAVFATSRPDLAADRAVGQLWRIELPAGTPRRLTRGVADTSPRLSPSGDRVAFLRADGDGRAQVHVVDAGGGEPVQATDTPLGVGGFGWSPDGTRLAYTARIPEPGRYGSVDGLAPEAESPRRITGVRWHADGLGYTADRPAQLFVVDAPDTGSEPFYRPAPRVLADDEKAPEAPVIAGEPRQLTQPPASWRFVAWSGEEVLVVPDVIEPDARDLRDRLVAVRADGSGERELVGRGDALSIDDAAVAADGAVFVVASEVGAHGRDFVAPATGLWIVDGASAPRLLTDAETIDLGEPGSHLTLDGDAVLVQDRTRGRVRLLRVERDGTATEVVGGDVEVTGHASAAGVTVVAVATPTSFGELTTVSPGGGIDILTSFGNAAAATGLARPNEIEIAARDGSPVHGWYAVPEGEGPFPVLLQIHGGPFAQYGVHLFDETQVLVDAGYAVVYANPRGSAGYGRAHGRAIRQAMGTVDLTDLLDFFDGVLAQDARLDAERLGVQGGSYGGYMTAWMIAHDSRFAGAIVERGMLDPASFQGTSDIGSFFGDEYVGTDPAAIARQSPFAVVGRVQTPTLVIHSELDFRCPLEQATRYYSALKRQGTEAEMLIFPGENHELSRSGRPRHRVERFEAILDWWKRRLPVS